MRKLIDGAAGPAPEEAAMRAAALVSAINARDRAALDGLLAPGAEVVTGRNVHAGGDAILAWADKRYDHLTKRYAIDEYRADGERVLALGSVQYVWTDGGEVADTSPIALLIELTPGGMRRLTVNDDVRAALIAFESAA